MAEKDMGIGRAWNVALGLLARRGHTARELETKLRKRGFDRQTAEAVVSKCERMRFIDDRETGRAYLKELVRKGRGPRRIRMEMSRKGLDDPVIDELMENMGVEKKERQFCRMEMEKKLGAVSAEKDSRKKKARVYRFLVSRGFSSSVVCELLGECGFEDE